MILVFGKNGQVATALREILPQATFLGSDVANFLDLAAIKKSLDQHKPRVVINAAAYTQVDKAESEKEAALTINGTTPGVIAEWCKSHDALLVHYSTDYVFDGSGEKPWLETDQPNPVNYYGFSKWQGEKAIQASGCKHYIFRVSWVYSPWGQNFKKTILRLAQEREELNIVGDQWGAPTKAEDIARETKKVIEGYLNHKPLEFGLYHWRFNDYTTWHQFAVDIVEEAKKSGVVLKIKNLNSIPTEAYPTPAKRPKNSRLGTNRFS
ncbi:MAG TPA: dTDP-4-dehydrorhamnose reductase [Pseudobdellovibrionaceae bacterium]|jgi:dTDP-4-dehydrorhamnose reductase